MEKETPISSLVQTLLLAVVVLLMWHSPASSESFCTEGSLTHRVQMVLSDDLGTLDLTLCTQDAPITVESFLSYVQSGAYTNTGIIHRKVLSASYSIFQGGGYFIDTTSSGTQFLNSVVRQNPIPMEKVLPNVAGSIAMARTNSVDSATSQWFINITDNPDFDSPTNEYAAFGSVSAESFTTIDAVVPIPTTSINSFFTDIPVNGYPGDGSPYPPYFVVVSEIIDLPEPSSGLQAVFAILGLGFVTRIRRASSKGVSLHA